MLKSAQKIIPILTTEAGSCLTAANWQEVGVNTGSYYLNSLLLKPGLEFLKQLPNLNEYLGWSGSIILNASNLVANREGVITIVSPYDGSKIKLTATDLTALIKHLKPQAVILPKNCPIADWDESVFPFIATEDVATQNFNAYGVYLHLKEDNNNVDALDQSSSLPRYVMGDFSLDYIHYLNSKGVGFVETNQPALLALQGIIYSDHELIDLKNTITAMQFDNASISCRCPTCAQQFTRAYLHHLYHHTPLLCHRFLVQHNIYYALGSYDTNKIN